MIRLQCRRWPFLASIHIQNLKYSFKYSRMHSTPNCGHSIHEILSKKNKTRKCIGEAQASLSHILCTHSLYSLKKMTSEMSHVPHLWNSSLQKTSRLVLFRQCRIGWHHTDFVSSSCVVIILSSYARVWRVIEQQALIWFNSLPLDNVFCHN